MDYRENFLKAARKIGKQLHKVFPYPSVPDMGKNIPGEFVLNTPEMEELPDDAEAAKAVIENVDRVTKHLKRESGHYAYPEEQRRELVEKYRDDNKRGRVANKEAWAQSHAGVSATAFSTWENEFPE